MDLYNKIIRKTEESFGSSVIRRYEFDPAKAWKDSGQSELVMLRDAAYELGGDDKPSANFSCVTTDATLDAGRETRRGRWLVLGIPGQRISEVFGVHVTAFAS